MLSDIISGVKAGHPILRYTMSMAYTEQQRTRVDSLVDYPGSKLKLQYPGDWKPLTQLGEEEVMAFNMTIPYVGEKWDEGLGLMQYPRGNKSTSFIKASRLWDWGWEGGGKRTELR